MAIREWSWWKLYTKVKPLLDVHRTETELHDSQVASPLSADTQRIRFMDPHYFFNAIFFILHRSIVCFDSLCGLVGCVLIFTCSLEPILLANLILNPNVLLFFLFYSILYVLLNRFLLKIMFLGGTGTHKSQVGKSGEGETGVQTDSGEAGCQGNINNNKK